MDLLRSRRFAKELFQCYDGKVGPVYGNKGKLSVSRDYRNAYMTYTPGGYTLQVYAHEIDGKRVDAKYLGAENQTTWGFYYQESTECGKNGFYQVKLLGLPNDPNTVPRAATDPQFKGFLKVVQYS